MRLLICLLLTLGLTVPALADDWDGDQVVRKNRKSEKTEKKARDEKFGKQDKALDVAQPPLGMYFGNGDEFLERGAPQGQHWPESLPTVKDVAAPAETFEDALEGARSAILGSRHKPPSYFQAPADDSQPEPVIEEVVAAAVESESPTAIADKSGSNFEQLALPEATAPVEALPAEAAPTVDPDSGLARYSSYPAMQGKVRTKRHASKKERVAGPEDEPQAQRRGGIRMHDPDTW